jgi:hypothetical protein
VNEALYRALLDAQLSGEDVAARLQVDPKTVRCWLDGRMPYLRHRWALARLVGMDEADIWPQLRSARSRPSEVVAVYPHRDSVPPGEWLSLFRGARREAGVLADSEFLLADGLALPALLGSLARAGVRVRVCLADPATPEGQQPGPERLGASPLTTAAVRQALDPADLRVHGAGDYHTICYADDDLMVAQHAYGVPDSQAPVLRLRRAADGDMASAYLGSFERIWIDARALE